MPMAAVLAAVNIERTRVFTVFVGAEFDQTLIRRLLAAVLGLATAGLSVTSIHRPEDRGLARFILAGVSRADTAATRERDQAEIAEDVY